MFVVGGRPVNTLSLKWTVERWLLKGQKTMLTDKSLEKNILKRLWNFDDTFDGRNY